MIIEGYDYIDQVKQLIIQYNQELNRDLSFQGIDNELDHLEIKYGYPRGRLFVYIDHDQVSGCIAYQKINDHTCEMKRLYVLPEQRGKNISVLLVETLEEQAKMDGYEYMVLDTIKPLQAAISLYRKMGFKETEPYYNNPMDDVIYMKKKL